MLPVEEFDLGGPRWVGVICGHTIHRRGRCNVTRVATITVQLNALKRRRVSSLLSSVDYSATSSDGVVTASELKQYGAAKYVAMVEDASTPFVITRQNRPVAVLSPGSYVNDLVATIRPMVAAFDAVNGDIVDNNTPLPEPIDLDPLAEDVVLDAALPVNVAVLPTDDGGWRRDRFEVPAATFETREAALANVFDVARTLDVEFQIDDPDETERAAPAPRAR